MYKAGKLISRFKDSCDFMDVNKGTFILNVDFWFSESVLSFKCKTKKSLITRQCKYFLTFEILTFI